jgi:hypothetical protein
MLNKFTLSAVLIAVAATASSAAFAAAKTTRHDNLKAFAAVPATRDSARASAASPATRPMSGAEWFQNKGIAEEMGLFYWGR